MAPVTEAVLNISFGEGPHWDEEEQVLYYVNLLDNTINKFNPATRERTSSEFDDHASFIIPIEGKKHHFLVAIKRDIIEIEWNGDNDSAKVIRTVAQVDDDKPCNLLNDGKADSRGRLFTGKVQLDDKISLSNGLAWDVEGKFFYYVDSMDAIRRYDYDIETGNITNCQKIFVAADYGLKGLCDGMTIDTDGNLWVAVVQCNKVVKNDGKTGKLLQKITIPSSLVTSVAFGGPNLDILYVTSGNMHWKKHEAVWGAALYEVTGLGVRGCPSFKVKIN